MRLESLLGQLPVNGLVIGTRLNEIALAREVTYGNLAHEYLKLSVRISRDLRLPYHQDMSQTRGHLRGCCHRNEVDLFIDTYGGENIQRLKRNNFRIADIAFLAHTKGAIEDIYTRLENGSFSQTEMKISGERISQLENNLYLRLQRVYKINSIKPEKSNDILYDRVFNGSVSNDMCRLIEMGKVIYGRKQFLYDANVIDCSPGLGNLSMQVREAR